MYYVVRRSHLLFPTLSRAGTGGRSIGIQVRCPTVVKTPSCRGSVRYLKTEIANRCPSLGIAGLGRNKAKSQPLRPSPLTREVGITAHAAVDLGLPHCTVTYLQARLLVGLLCARYDGYCASWFVRETFQPRGCSDPSPPPVAVNLAECPVNPETLQCRYLSYLSGFQFQRSMND